MWKIVRNWNRQQGQRGDTLVEVMISIVIVSSVIGGAYVVSNHSLQATRSAQERSNALKLAESQLEQLKSLIATDPTPIFGGGAVPAPPPDFCLGSDATGTHVYDISIAAQKVKCTVDTAGVPTTNQPAYTLKITRAGNNFTLNESWTDVSGRFSNALKLNYRAYQ